MTRGKAVLMVEERRYSSRLCAAWFLSLITLFSEFLHLPTVEIYASIYAPVS